MKTLEEISKQGRIIFHAIGQDGGAGYIPGLDRKHQNRMAQVIWSNGGGWDHVSVSFKDRTPSWDEMCRVKDMFFYPEETCIEYHPKRSEYVNQHQYCLHIWRPQETEIPLPPSWMVGCKEGESLSEVMEKAEIDLGG